MRCKYCSHCCRKAGKQKNGKQKYLCKECGKYQQATYHYRAYQPSTCKKVVNLCLEGLGIRSISRYLAISKTTVLKYILAASKKVAPPKIEGGKDYEIDELYTFVGSKSQVCWLFYSLCKQTRQVVSFALGARSQQTAGKVTEKLKEVQPNKIYTDKLNLYPSLLVGENHIQGRVNQLERYNLTLRTHLKRLSRKSINFSKTFTYLEAVLRLYFWHKRVDLKEALEKRFFDI
ncbi:MAG: IS1 family transposase [Thermonemataceae bacterium]